MAKIIRISMTNALGDGFPLRKLCGAYYIVSPQRFENIRAYDVITATV